MVVVVACAEVDVVAVSGRFAFMPLGGLAPVLTAVGTSVGGVSRALSRVQSPFAFAYDTPQRHTKTKQGQLVRVKSGPD